MYLSARASKLAHNPRSTSGCVTCLDTQLELILGLMAL